MIPSTSTTLSS